MFIQSFRSSLIYRYVPRTTSRLYAFRKYYSTEPLVKPSKVINIDPNLNLKLLISKTASDRLGQIHKDSNENLRVKVESGGCHGFQYLLQLEPETPLTDKSQETQAEDKQKATQSVEEEEDIDFSELKSEKNPEIQYILENGSKIKIDQKSLKILNNSCLVYSTELIGSSFKITGGELKSPCGCGSSFDVE